MHGAGPCLDEPGASRRAIADQVMIEPLIAFRDVAVGLMDIDRHTPPAAIARGRLRPLRASVQDFIDRDQLLSAGKTRLRVHVAQLPTCPLTTMLDALC